MASRLGWTVRDKDGQRTSRSLPGIEFLPDGSNYVATYQKQLALRDAILNVTTCTLYSNEAGGNTQILNAPLPTDDYAQRNIEWQIYWQDTTTGLQAGSLRLAGANLTLAVVQSSPIGNYVGLPLTSGVGAVLKAAFGAYVVNPDNGDAPCELIGCIYLQG